MRTRLVLKAFVLAAAIAVTLSLVGRPAATSTAHAGPGCDLGDLNGTFAFSLHGVNPSGEPFGAVGPFTADGEGGIEGFRVSADNGLWSSANFTCEYSMSPGCMFRTGATCMDVEEAVSEVMLDGALADNRREAHLLATGVPAGGLAVVTGIARKQ